MACFGRLPSCVGGGRLVLAAAILGAGLAVGCAAPKVTMAQLDPAGEGAPVTAIAPGDEVDVRFFYTPELNVVQKVRPDGKISMQLVGDVQADGLTPPELSQKLRTLYEKELNQPDIAVLLRSQWARIVFVGGQVKKPGTVPLPVANRVTVQDAVMFAEGYDPATAELENVLVIRQKEGKVLVGSFDLRPAFGLEEPPKDGIKPFYLQPYDIVYVPETRIVQVDRWIDQNINKVIPDVGFFITTQTGTTTVGYLHY